MSAWTGRFAGLQDALARRGTAIALVVLLLLAELVVPSRIAAFGVTGALLLAVGLLIAVFGARVWPLLLLLICYAPFASYLRFQGLSNLQSLLKDLLALGVVGLWAAGALVRRDPLVRTPLDAPILLFVLLGVVSLLRAPTLLRGALAFKIFFTYVPIYFLVVQAPPSRRQLRIVLWALLAVGAITAVYGILQYSHAVPTPAPESLDPAADFAPRLSLSNWRFEQVRSFSTFSHANLFGLFLAMCLAVGLAFWRVASRPARILLGLLIAAVVAAIPTTLARTSWIAAGLAMLILAILAPTARHRAAMLLAAGLAIAAFALAGPIVGRTLSFTGGAEDISFQQRPVLLYWAARMTFVEMPQGCGLGALGDAADLAARATHTYQPPVTCLWRGFPVQTGDTVAFSIGVQMGALGYLLYAWIFVLIWMNGLRIYRSLTDRFLKGVAAGILAYLGVMTASNFFSGSPSSYPVVDFYFWLFVGILFSLKRIEDTSAAIPSG